MNIKKYLTQEEIEQLEKYLGEDGIAEHYRFSMQHDELTHEDAIADLKNLAGTLAEYEHNYAIIEAMNTRPVEESPDFLVVKEEVKRYFARVTGDADAQKKADRRVVRHQKKLYEEREVENDARGIQAASQLYCVEPIAQAFKHKLFLHWENTYTNILAMNEAVYLAKQGAGFLSLGRKSKQTQANRDAIITKGIRAIEGNCTQAVTTMFCARLMEAYLDSPHVYFYVRGTDEEGNVCDLMEQDIRDFLRDNAGQLTETQRAQLEENANELRAVQGAEVAKACRKAARKIDPARIKAGENFVGVLQDNEEKLVGALVEALKAEGGKRG